METKQIVEKLIEFRNIHQVAIDTATSLLEEVLPWTPKEFTFKDAVVGGLPSPSHTQLSDLEHLRAKAEGFLVEPRATLGITFGDLHVIPDTVIFDIPETAQVRFGVQNTFRLRYLLIDEEVASNFDVAQLLIGVHCAWRINSLIPAIKFTKPIDLKVEAVQPGISASLTVINNTDKPQWFRAKLVGEELILPWTESANA